MVSLAHNIDMNRSIDICNINSFNSDQSRSDTTSTRMDTRIEMNREGSLDNNNEDMASKDDKAMVPLHKDFQPGDDDVICGRGKKCYAHTGNERFRVIVNSFLEKYSAASSRPEKSEILSAVVAQVRKNSPEGGFVKQDTTSGEWFEVGDFLAREKTSQAFRDALHEQYRSSKKSKHEKRRQKTKEKAQNEELKAAHRTGGSPEMSYPVSASPLVSRHHLTSLREEHHPRAYSFSGHNNSMPVRGAPSRALSLSSGRGGGRHSDLHNMAAYREHSFQRHDSAPRLPSHDLSEISPAVTRHDEAAGMHESWPRASMRHRDERTDFGNDSWPARSRRSPSQAMFEPPHHAYQAPPPPLSHTQFHPIAPEGVTAMKPIYSDTDEIMLEVENVQSEHFHDQHQHTHWTVDAMECESSHSRRGSMVGDTAYAPPSMDTGFPCREQCEIRSSPKHLRNDSTVTATVIVAQLSSALSDSLPEDDNPFEPIPLNSTPPK